MWLLRFRVAIMRCHDGVVAGWLQFEFRAVGAPQPVARSSTILNAIFCDSLNAIADAVDKATANKRECPSEL